MNKTELLDKILSYELPMFLSVNEEKPSEYKKHLDLFFIDRKAQLSVYSNHTLLCYLNDLIFATERDENLFTLKYAIIDKTISPDEKKQMIVDYITSKLIIWQKEFLAKLNNNELMPSRPIEDDTDVVSFKNYISSELYTYSLETLNSFKSDVDEYLSNGSNLSQKIYEYYEILKERMDKDEVEDEQLIDSLFEKISCSFCCKLPEIIIDGIENK